MMIQTKDGRLVNLAHAFSIEYNREKEKLETWMAFSMPAEPDRTELAGMWDTARFVVWPVHLAEWERFKRATLSAGTE